MRSIRVWRHSFHKRIAAFHCHVMEFTRNDPRWSCEWFSRFVESKCVTIRFFASIWDDWGNQQLHVNTHHSTVVQIIIPLRTHFWKNRFYVCGKQAHIYGEKKKFCSHEFQRTKNIPISLESANPSVVIMMIEATFMSLCQSQGRIPPKIRICVVMV